MKLYIDTSDSNKTIVVIDGETFESIDKVNKSQEVLPLIEKALSEKNKKIDEITEIEVNTGPGSFTGIRVGVSVAQTIGWYLGIKVNGKIIPKEKIELSYED